jgi:hypothetical protein
VRGGRLGFTSLTWILTAACVAVLVAGLALTLVVRNQQADLEDGGMVRVTGSGDVRTATDYDEVVQAAQRFTVTWNTIDANDAETYVQDVRPLVTDEFFEEAFQGEEQAAVELIQKGGVTSTGKVLVDEEGSPLVGVSSIDPNSAIALVVADSTRKVNGQQAVRHWRWQLELVKDGDDWLVNDLTQV